MVLQLDDFALYLIHLLDSVGAPDAWSYSVFFRENLGVRSSIWESLICGGSAASKR